MGVIIQGNTIIQGQTIFGFVKPSPTIAATQEYISVIGTSSSVGVNTITAPANSILVLMATSNSYTDTFLSLTDTVGLTWTQRANWGAGGNHYQYIYTAPFTSGGAITTTFTYTPSSSGRVHTSLNAVINSSGVGTASSTIGSTLSITTVAANSLILAFESDINGQQNANYIMSPILNLITTPAATSCNFLYGYTTTIGTYTYTVTNSTSGSNNNGQIIELKP